MSAPQKEAILESMAKVQEELDSIKKDQQGYNYKFRGIDQVLNTLSPLFKKHKIITTRRNLRSNRVVREVVSTKLIEKNVKNEETGKFEKVKVPQETRKEFVEVELKADYVFKSLVDGSEIVSEGFGEGQDTSGGDKASSMATSNSYKYVIFEMFNIATEEQKDSDQVTAETAKKTSSFAVKEDVVKQNNGMQNPDAEGSEELMTPPPRTVSRTRSASIIAEESKEVQEETQPVVKKSRSFRKE